MFTEWMTTEILDKVLSLGGVCMGRGHVGEWLFSGFPQAI